MPGGPNFRIAIHRAQAHADQATIGISAEQVPAAMRAEGLGLAVGRSPRPDRLSALDDLESLDGDSRVQRRGRPAAWRG